MGLATVPKYLPSMGQHSQRRTVLGSPEGSGVPYGQSSTLAIITSVLSKSQVLCIREGVDTSS